MLLFRRRLTTSTLRLQLATQSSVGTIFRHSCFDPIRKHLPVEVDNLDPYSLSQKVDESLKISKDLNFDQTAKIHNHLIENLTKFEYGIATLHSKKLDKLNKPITIQALSQMLEHNPGRVNSSWEIFTKYKKVLNTLPEKVVLITLDKIVSFDPAEIKDGKKDLNMSDILHAVYLLGNLADTKSIDQKIINKLTTAALKLKMTSMLPTLFKFNPSLESILDEQIEELTPYQLQLVANNFKFESIKEQKPLFYQIIDNLGQNEFISMNEDESEMLEKTKKRIELVNKEFNDNWSLQLPESSANNTESFNNFLDEIAQNDSVKDDFILAKKLLRIIGIYKGNTKSFMELCELFTKSFPEKKEELNFETFLTLSYQGYKTSNETGLHFADAYVSDIVNEAIKLKAMCVKMVVNAKFNIEDSLNIYNENIGKLSKEKDALTNLSPSDIATEALVLAFLSQKDLDFARVIVEGSIKSQVMSGATAVKNAKSILSAYGDALENGDLDSMLQQRVNKYLQAI